MEEIHRYKDVETLVSHLDPLEDVICWIEGLTSTVYVKDLLKSKHNLTANTSIRQRSEDVAKLVEVACKYLEQARKGPEEVAFLPLYYAVLNLVKCYIIVGPYYAQLASNRWHGIRYDTSRNFNSLDDDSIEFKRGGAVPLFYNTVVGQSMFQNVNPPYRMREIYPYIIDIRAEYGMATRSKDRLLPFVITVNQQGQRQRVEATYWGRDKRVFSNVRIGTLQAFKGLRRETKDSSKLISRWYTTNDTTHMMECVRPAMLYGSRFSQSENAYDLVPSVKLDIFLPEELPIICAFFHMSNIVRYNPDGLEKLADSKYWPSLLTLRRHGLYKFLLLFWSFINQCCTFIAPE
jgi:hypothetical protein